MEQDSLLDSLGDNGREDATENDASSPLLHEIEEDEEDDQIKHELTN